MGLCVLRGVDGLWLRSEWGFVFGPGLWFLCGMFAVSRSTVLWSSGFFAGALCSKDPSRACGFLGLRGRFWVSS